MSLILKGIDLPQDCVECPLEENAVDGDGFDYWYCKITESTIGIADTNKRPSNCPLIQIPKDHGDIKDAGALKTVFEDMAKCEWNQKVSPISWAYAFENVIDEIDNTPTILEAEEKDGNKCDVV